MEFEGLAVYLLHSQRPLFHLFVPGVVIPVEILDPLLFDLDWTVDSELHFVLLVAVHLFLVVDLKPIPL